MFSPLINRLNNSFKQIVYNSLTTYPSLFNDTYCVTNYHLGSDLSNGFQPNNLS